MILIITDVTDQALQEIQKMALSYGCKIENLDQKILIEKNSQISVQEFSLLAGKIVMTGSTVKLED